MKNCIVKYGIIFSCVLVVSVAGASVSQAWYNGIYVGGQVGYVDGEANHTFSNNSPFTNNVPPGDSEPDGMTAGLFMGYQKKVGDFVVGAEIGYEKPNVEGSFADTFGDTSAGSVDFNSTYYLRAKLGYSLSSINTVPYLIGGITYCDVDIAGGPSFNPNGGRYSKTYQGWLAGAGVERSLNEKFTLRLEYLYADYGSERGELLPDYSSIYMPVDLKTQSLQMGLYYQF